MKMDKTKEPTVIHCTTTTTIVNTKTGKTYKDEQERDADVNDPNTGTTMEHIKQDVLVEVSPKSLEVLQKIWKAQNKDDKSKA